MTQRLILRHGDCVEVLKGYDDGSIGAFCCDPPYGLEFMGKKWDRLDWTDGGGMMGVGMGGREIPWPSYSGTGAAGAANATCATCGGRMRGGNKCSCDKPDWRVKGQPLILSANAERMQKQQHSHRIWLTEAYRVLRPGGIIKAFSGTRTFHRMVAAMQEAGFRDLRLESWNYGSGFPKSLNIGKALDKRPGAVAHYPEIKKFLADAIKTSPKTRSQVDEECGFSACDFARTTGSSPFVNVIPDAHKWGIMRGVLCFDARWDEAVEAAERAVIGAGASGSTAMWTPEGGVGKFDVTSPASDAAQRWNGWGTALKPSWEPVCVGRKP